mgnify:CR=1 FL=1
MSGCECQVLLLDGTLVRITVQVRRPPAAAAVVVVNICPLLRLHAADHDGDNNDDNDGDDDDDGDGAGPVARLRAWLPAAHGSTRPAAAAGGLKAHVGVVLCSAAGNGSMALGGVLWAAAWPQHGRLVPHHALT